MHLQFKYFTFSDGTLLSRMFTKDRLNAAAVGEKWNLVKVVCTQPFSKHIQVPGRRYLPVAL